MIIRTKEDEINIKKYKCLTKAKFANSRFDDKICGSDVFDVLKRYNFNCFYCGVKLNHTNWQLDHFFPRAMKSKNTFENLVCTCKWCNTMKNALDGFAFVNKCKVIAEKNYLSINNIPLK